MNLSPCVFLDDPLPPHLADPRRELGGKGMSLRQLHEADVRVPCGFTVQASVCRRFLQQDTWSDSDLAAILLAVERLEQQLISGNNGPMPRLDERPLAVRSGAAVSMPGLLRSHFNIPCCSADDNTGQTSGDPHCAVRHAIEDVFRSWNSDAAEHYRRCRGIDHEMATAVTIQEMFDCRLAGVMLTRMEDTDQVNLVVEAVSGSGTTLVAGCATPHRWVISRQDQCVVSSPEEMDNAFAGFDAILAELVAIGLRLERHFGEPLDIEWGLDDQGLVFFQARSIEAGSDLQPAAIRESQRDQIRRLAESGARCWVRHNLSETLAYPTPLTWSLWQQFMSGSGALGTLYRRLGYSPGKQVDREGFLTLIAGHIYADPDRATAMFGAAYPWSYDLEQLQRDHSTLDAPPRHFDPERLDPFFLWRIPELAWRTWRAHRRLAQWLESADQRFEQQIVPKYLQFVAKEQTVDLSMLTHLQLSTLFEERRHRVMDVFGPESLLPGTLGIFAQRELCRQVTRVLGPQVGDQLTREMTLVERQPMWQRLGILTHTADDAPADSLMAAFGHRAIGEMELSVPRLRETPELLSQLTDGLRSPPAAVPESKAAASIQHLRDAFVDVGAETLFPPVSRWFEHCSRLLPYRDRGKHLLLLGYELLRQVAEEMSRRFQLGDAVYYLTHDEWPELIAGADLESRIAARRQERMLARQWNPPDFINARHLESLMNAGAARTDANELQGSPLTSGFGQGRVWNLADEATGPLSETSVLVCASLEPALAPLLSQTAAVIVQQGGTLSHGAILARQLGLPVVRLPDATRILASGQFVNVDGQSGRIEIIDRNQR